jgi:hypothetical protein
MLVAQQVPGVQQKIRWIDQFLATLADVREVVPRKCLTLHLLANGAAQLRERGRSVDGRE